MSLLQQVVYPTVSHVFTPAGGVVYPTASHVLSPVRYVV